MENMTVRLGSEVGTIFPKSAKSTVWRVMPKALPFLSYVSALPPLYLLQKQSSLYNTLTKCLPLERTFSASLTSNPSLACTEKAILLFSTWDSQKPPQVTYVPPARPCA